MLTNSFIPGEEYPPFTVVGYCFHEQAAAYARELGADDSFCTSTAPIGVIYVPDEVPKAIAWVDVDLDEESLVPYLGRCAHLGYVAARMYERICYEKQAPVDDIIMARAVECATQAIWDGFVRRLVDSLNTQGTVGNTQWEIDKSDRWQVIARPDGEDLTAFDKICLFRAWQNGDSVTNLSVMSGVPEDELTGILEGIEDLARGMRIGVAER
jgi:hypothetical protein